MSRHVDMATFGIETAYKTPQTTLVGMLLIDPQDFDPASADRPTRQHQRPHSGGFQSLKGFKHATWGGKTEFNAPSASGDAPHYDAWLQACGFSKVTTTGESVAYNPILEDVKSLSAEAYKDNDLHRLIGLRGGMSFDLAVGAIPSLSATFNGHHNGYATQSLASGTVVAEGFARALREDEVVVTYAGMVVCFQSAAGKMGTVVEHDNSNCDNWDITDHVPDITLTISKVDFATRNFFANADDDLVAPLSIMWGKTGHRIRISAPAASLGKVGYGKQGKSHTLSLPLSLLPVNGSDEILIEMGALT